MFQNIQIENSLLRPTVHDERADTWGEEARGYIDDEDDEEVFEDDEIDEF